MVGASLGQLPSDECQWTLVMIRQHWFRQWLGVVRHQAITWANADPYLCCHMASLGSNEFWANKLTTRFSYSSQTLLGNVHNCLCAKMTQSQDKNIRMMGFLWSCHHGSQNIYQSRQWSMIFIYCCYTFMIRFIIWYAGDKHLYWDDIYHYHQTSNISRIKSQKRTVSRLVLQLFLPNPVKPGVKWRMKM